LDRNLALFYSALFYLAHPEEHPERASPVALRVLFDRSKTRAARPTTRRDFTSLPPLAEASSSDSPEDIFEVLAALGKPDLGVTLGELTEQTGKSETGLAKIMSELQAAGLVERRESVGTTGEVRFLPAAGHMNFSWLPRHGGARTLFLGILKRNLAVAANHFVFDLHRAAKARASQRGRESPTWTGTHIHSTSLLTSLIFSAP